MIDEDSKDGMAMNKGKQLSTATNSSFIHLQYISTSPDYVCRLYLSISRLYLSSADYIYTYPLTKSCLLSGIPSQVISRGDQEPTFSDQTVTAAMMTDQAAARYPNVSLFMRSGWDQNSQGSSNLARL